MLPPPKDLDVLTAALLSAERTVVLAGQRLDEEGIADMGHTHSEWASHADLDRLLTAPADFWRFFLPAARAAAARVPTSAHRALVRLEHAGAIAAVVTQAIDGLHERAGAHRVVEVYGNALTARCERCGERYGLDEVAVFMRAVHDAVPRCTTPGCGYPLRPHGTLWNEPLPAAAIERAWEWAGECDLFLVVDSDLRTAPISLLPSVPLTRGIDVIVVGASPTRYDRYARQVIRVDSSADTLSAVADRIAPAHR